MRTFICQTGVSGGLFPKFQLPYVRTPCISCLESIVLDMQYEHLSYRSSFFFEFNRNVIILLCHSGLLATVTQQNQQHEMYVSLYWPLPFHRPNRRACRLRAPQKSIELQASDVKCKKAQCSLETGNCIVGQKVSFFIYVFSYYLCNLPWKGIPVTVRSCPSPFLAARLPFQRLRCRTRRRIKRLTTVTAGKKQNNPSI